MKFIAVIPARYSSVRFPGKSLAILQDKYIIQHVYEKVLGSGLFQNVFVATDDGRISDAVKSFGGSYRMTSDRHPSGSDRIAEVVKNLDCDVVFNVQGDEPMIETKPLVDLKLAFNDPQVLVATLMTPLEEDKELLNINMVKVITDNNMKALYFSRFPIPYNRDKISGVEYFKHVGVYAYRKQTLLDYVQLPQGKLERAEKLEQLRFIENGIPIRMVLTNYQGIGVDTPDDLQRIEHLLSQSIDN